MVISVTPHTAEMHICYFRTYCSWWCRGINIYYSQFWTVRVLKIKLVHGKFCCARMDQDWIPIRYEEYKCEHLIICLSGVKKLMTVLHKDYTNLRYVSCCAVYGGGSGSIDGKYSDLSWCSWSCLILSWSYRITLRK